MIFDSHNNHHTIDFNNYCKNNNIVLLCMLVYLFHIFQPLNVRCFGFLKALYNKKIEQMIYMQIIHITKNNFFLAFKCIFYVIINLKNIQIIFKIISLILYNPKKVINNLDFKFHTPTPSNFCLTNFRFINLNTSCTAKDTIQNFINLKNKIVKH